MTIVEKNPQRHPLYPVFMAAINQAMNGKGERHGGSRKPFYEQQWKILAESHGIAFLTGQSAKKLNEGIHKAFDREAIRELLGSMVYTGMAILAMAHYPENPDGYFEGDGEYDHKGMAEMKYTPEYQKAEKPKPLVYLAGPMTGYPEHNFPLFNSAADFLREKGYDVLNPAEFPQPESPCWEEYLRIAIHQLTERKPSLFAVLPDWQCSKGAKLEIHIAHELGIPVLPFHAISHEDDIDIPF